MSAAGCLNLRLAWCLPHIHYSPNTHTHTHTLQSTHTHTHTLQSTHTHTRHAQAQAHKPIPSVKSCDMQPQIKQEASLQPECSSFKPYHVWSLNIRAVNWLLSRDEGHIMSASHIMCEAWNASTHDAISCVEAFFLGTKAFMWFDVCPWFLMCLIRDRADLGQNNQTNWINLSCTHMKSFRWTSFLSSARMSCRFETGGTCRWAPAISTCVYVCANVCAFAWVLACMCVKSDKGVATISRLLKMGLFCRI